MLFSLVVSFSGMCLVFVVAVAVAVVAAFVVVLFTYLLPFTGYYQCFTCSFCTPFGRISVYNPDVCVNLILTFLSIL